MTLTDKDYERAAAIFTMARRETDRGASAMRRAFDYLMGLRSMKGKQERDQKLLERRKVEAAR